MEKTSEGDENRETSIPRHCRLTRRSLLKSAAAVASAAILPSGLAATAFYFQSVFGTKSDSAKSKPLESNLGSAAHSRRAAKAGLPSLGDHCLTMASASPEKSRSRQTLADVPPEPSRGDCSHGLFHGTDAHVWRSVLLLRHKPRPAKNSAFQRDTKSECSLDCPADAGGMAVHRLEESFYPRVRF
jgi:hypothetical protein